jgi:hypothetical protein
MPPIAQKHNPHLYLWPAGLPVLARSLFLIFCFALYLQYVNPFCFCFAPLKNQTQASALGTTIELFLRLPMDSIRAYESLVPTNPVFYKACTSGVAYTVGDFVSQVFAPSRFLSCDPTFFLSLSLSICVA